MLDTQMSGSPASPRLAMSWVPVTDARGRVRLEARWGALPADTVPQPRQAA